MGGMCLFMKINVNDNFDMNTFNTFIDNPSLISDYINSYEKIIKDVEDLKNKDISDIEYYVKFNSIFRVVDYTKFSIEALDNILGNYGSVFVNLDISRLIDKKNVIDEKIWLNTPVYIKKDVLKKGVKNTSYGFILNMEEFIKLQKENKMILFTRECNRLFSNKGIDFNYYDVTDMYFYDIFDKFFGICDFQHIDGDNLNNVCSKYLKFVRANSYSLIDEAVGKYNIRFKRNLNYLREYFVISKEKIVYFENVIDKIDDVLDNKNDDVKKKVLFC